MLFFPTLITYLQYQNKCINKTKCCFKIDTLKMIFKIPKVTPNNTYIINPQGYMGITESF